MDYNFIPYFSCAEILLEGNVKDLDHQAKAVNCYGPYGGRKDFGDEVVDGRI